MRTKITEGFKGEGSPDLKYYAFDWDDNIVHMPTKIIVKTEVGDRVNLESDLLAKYAEKLLGKA